MKAHGKLRLAASFFLILALFFGLLPQRAAALDARALSREEEISAPLTDEERKENLRLIVEYLREEMGMNDAAVAAIVANIARESNFDPRAVDVTGYFTGICQWSPIRWSRFVLFCIVFKLDPYALESQLLYLKAELETDYSDLLNNTLLLLEDSEDGALYGQWYFCQYFEIPLELEKEQEARAWLVYLKYWPLVSTGELARKESDQADGA